MRNESNNGARKPTQPVEVVVKPHTYQPSKAELEADITVDATPEEMRSVLTRSVVIKEKE